MLGIILGIVSIWIGTKASSPRGLPLSPGRNLTGTTGKVVGVICIVLGALLIVDGAFSAIGIFAYILGPNP
jgi:hypothetical protein